MRLTTSLTLTYLLIAGITPAQTVTENLSVPSLPLDVRSISVAAAQANEQSSFIVENSTSGGGTIDALSLDACAVISLVTPGGVNVNAANAVSLGYGYDRQTIGTGSLYLGIFGLPGTHTTFRIPPTAGNGAFKVRVDAAACTSAIAVRAVYASVSTVQLAPIVPPRAVARNVSLAVGGVVLDDGNPVLGATLSASISTTTDISAQVQLQNYQLQSQTTLPDSTIEMQYLVDLGNNGAPLTHAIARLISGDPAAFVLTPALSFGAVATTAKVTDTSDSLTPAIDTQRLATIGKSSPVVCARRSRRGGGTARP